MNRINHINIIISIENEIRNTKESYYKFYRDVGKMSKSMIVI